MRPNPRGRVLVVSERRRAGFRRYDIGSGHGRRSRAGDGIYRCGVARRGFISYLCLPNYLT